MTEQNVVALDLPNGRVTAFWMEGDWWLPSVEVTRGLGYPDAKSVRKLYERHADEFTADETRMMSLPTENRGEQLTRVFSSVGVRILSMYARTPDAPALRRALAKLKDGYSARPRLGQTQLALFGSRRPPAEVLRFATDALALIKEGHPAEQVLTEFRDGVRTAEEDPQMERSVFHRRAGMEHMILANREFRMSAAIAAEAGYTMDAVKAAERRTRGG